MTPSVPTARNAPTAAVVRAMRQAAAHDSVADVRLVVCDDEAATVEIDVRTEMPATWRAAGSSPSGVRVMETVTIRFPTRYPLTSPSVELRTDFDRSHPHINPSRPGRPVRPCLVAGSVRELVQSRGFFGLVEQLVDWLEKASTFSLIDHSQGWEPIRRDEIDDIIAADAEALRRLATPAGGAQFAAASYVVGDNGLHHIALDARPMPLPPHAARLFTRDEREGFSAGPGLGIVAWPGRSGGVPIVADRYIPETVESVGELLDRAAAYGCSSELEAKLSWAAKCLDAHPPGHPVPVTIVLLARRPSDVIGTGSPIEICPYLIEATRGADLVDRARPVRIAAMRDRLSIPVLRRASGIDPTAARPPWTLIGCGSVGSKVALHLARAGLAPSALFDRDWFEPHNYARHAGLPDGDLEALFFRPKADEVARQLDRLGQPPVSTARNDVVELSASDAGRALLAPEGTTAIVDTTGSSVVREALALAPSTNGARVIGACLMGAGEVGYVTVEGPGGNPSASDLVVEAYRTISSQETLAATVSGAEAEAVAIGQGCSAVTFAMPDVTLSAMTASMAGPISRWIGGGLPETGMIGLGRLGVDGISQEWTMSAAEPWVVVGGEAAGDRIARLHPRVDAAIKADVARWQGVETGGVLIGRYNAAGGFFQVVDLLPAPEDSERSATRFILGTRGLTRAIRDVVRRSGGALQAVGTWHNHLSPSGPSLIDAASGATLALRQLEPLLMLIPTPAGYSHLVVEITEADRGQGGGAA